MIVEKISNVIFNEIGIKYEKDNLYQLQRRIDDFIKRESLVSADRLLLIINDKKNPLRSKFFDLCTNNESFFFRDPLFFDVIKRILFEKKSSGGTVKISSLGCSSGQEIYSLAMMLASSFPGLFLQSQLIGIDISESILQKARSGKFNWVEANRGLSKELLEQFFTKTGDNEMTVDKKLTSKVGFFQGNLLDLSIDLKNKISKSDLFLCRNVLYYHSENNKLRIISQISDLMSPDSILLLGNAEKISDKLDQLKLVSKQTDGIIYYQKS